VSQVEVVELSHTREPAAILEYRRDWERLAAGEPFSFPDFDECRVLTEGHPGDVLLIVGRSEGVVTTLACFYRVSTRKSFRVGERRLFSLPVSQVQLFGSSVLGNLGGATFSRMLDMVCAAFRFHLLTLGEIKVQSTLFDAAAAVGDRFLLAETSRKRSLRWLIRVPRDFETYLMSLGAKSRQNIRRELRRVEQRSDSRFQCVTAEEEVEAFLVAAESISRRTYQWNVGQRVNNDAPTRRALGDRSRNETLRCYLLWLENRPCAFMRGKLVQGVYELETTGFDPEFGKASPGAVLLIWAIRDLIEHSNCSVFDFGTGGDDVGYKARFGNESHACASLQLGPRSSIYSWLLFALQGGLNKSLNLANRVLGQGALRTRVKRALRKYGDGNSA